MTNKNRENEIMRAAGQISAARRQRAAKMCEVCGTRFEGLARARYCSNTCGVRAYRRRQRASTNLLEELAALRGRFAADNEDAAMLIRKAREERAASLARGTGAEQ
ncbi:MAG: hypothetical protein HYX51_07060 [Chloroflexi bacterium]|nr:hypothetical protein [Chloroflexota bacterium]